VTRRYRTRLYVALLIKIQEINSQTCSSSCCESSAISRVYRAIDNSLFSLSQSSSRRSAVVRDAFALISVRSADGTKPPEAGRYYHKIMKRDPSALQAPCGPLCRGESHLPSPSRGTYARTDGSPRNDRAKAQDPPRSKGFRIFWESRD